MDCALRMGSNLSVYLVCSDLSLLLGVNLSSFFPIQEFMKPFVTFWYCLICDYAYA